jgi:hypothetical protein
MTYFPIDRRSLFKGTGALVVSFGLPGGFAEAETGSAVKPPLAPDQLDSWLAIKSDGDVVAISARWIWARESMSRSPRSSPRSSTCRSSG